MTTGDGGGKKPDDKDPPVPPALPTVDPNDDSWDATIPEPDYAAEAAKWREEIQAAVGKADKAEKAEAERGKKKAEPAKADPPKEPAKVDAPKVETARTAAPKAEPVAAEASARLDARLAAEAAAAKGEPARPSAKTAAARTEALRAAALDDVAPGKARPQKLDDDLGGEPPGGGRWRKVIIAAALLAVLIIGLVALGKFNARDYYLVCGADQVTAEQGRSFPPWGSRRLTGPQWEPIKIPANAECEEIETTDVAELEEAFLIALEDQANVMLTSRNPSDIELAEKQLQQALLLTRDADRRDKRKNIERLLGDVEYWRGAAQVQQVIDLLKGAAGKFEGATVRRPKHTSDSAAWAGFARATAEELRLGPPELRPARPVDPNAPPPFIGTGNEPPPPPQDAGVPPVDAPPGTLLDPPADATPPPPDAGLPRGGVLL